MATDSRGKLVQAAFEALRTKGFAGASARTIAGLAGVNPGLIFYDFSGIDELLLEALREASEDRLDRYRGAARTVATPRELVALLRSIYEEDRESGHIRVVSEMVAGSVSRPELGRQVMALWEPWVTLAEDAVERVLADSPLAAIASAAPSAGVVNSVDTRLASHRGAHWAGSWMLERYSDRLLSGTGPARASHGRSSGIRGAVAGCGTARTSANA